MEDKKTSAIYLVQPDLTWEDAGSGITRQIMGYDPSLMVVRVLFETGAVSEPHAHPHAQSTCVAAGKFRVTVGTEAKVLSAGDGFYIPPGTMHAAECLEGGVLIDAFSPCREDFL